MDLMRGRSDGNAAFKQLNLHGRYRRIHAAFNLNFDAPNDPVRSEQAV